MSLSALYYKLRRRFSHWAGVSTTATH